MGFVSPFRFCVSTRLGSLDGRQAMVAERVWRASRNVPCHVRWRGLPPAVCRQPEWSCGGAESFRWWGDVAPRVSEGEPRFQHDRVPVARWVEVHVVKTAQTDPPVHIRAPALGVRVDVRRFTVRGGPGTVLPPASPVPRGKDQLLLRRVQPVRYRPVIFQGSRWFVQPRFVSPATLARSTTSPFNGMPTPGCRCRRPRHRAHRRA